MSRFYDNVVVFYDNVGGRFALTVCLILLQMDDARRIFAKQSADKAEEAKIALEKKEESHVAELKTKDAAASAKEADLSAQLEKTKRSARELLASKDSEAVAERKEHAAELERQSTALEAEFQCRICLKNEEFGILEQEYNIDLSTRDAELLEGKTLTKNANAELQSERSKAEKLESDLKEANQELVKVRMLGSSAAEAEANHTAALHTLNDKLNTTIQNANAALESEKSKAVMLESDLNVAKQELVKAKADLRRLGTSAAEAEANHAAALSAKDDLTKNANAALESEKIKAEKLESDLTEAKQELVKVKEDVRMLGSSAAEAEANNAAALSAKDDVHTKSLDEEKTLTRKANAELLIEISKTETLESDLIEMTRKKVVFLY